MMHLAWIYGALYHFTDILFLCLLQHGQNKFLKFRNLPILPPILQYTAIIFLLPISRYFQSCRYPILYIFIHIFQYFDKSGQRRSQTLWKLYIHKVKKCNKLLLYRKISITIYISLNNPLKLCLLLFRVYYLSVCFPIHT